MLRAGGRPISLLVLAVGVALTTGGGTTASVPRSATAPERLDHFKCYTTTKPPFKQRTVTVKDQFVDGKTNVLSLQTLCNPVSKNKGKVLQRRAHLTCYQTRDSGIDFKAQKVTISNQFGKRELAVRRPASLCVPSLKRKGTISPPTMPDPAKLVGHFRCYAVDPVPASKSVRLADQFTTTPSKVTRLVSLCNPVGKNAEPVRRPKAHLVCYAIGDAKRFSAVSVRVRNQFGLASLRAVKPQTLCLPSFKDRIG